MGEGRLWVQDLEVDEEVDGEDQKLEKVYLMVVFAPKKPG